MRELYLSEEESTEQFFVLVDDDGVRYQLSRAALEELKEEPTPTPEPESAPEPEPLPEPDPLFANALTMRPNEIQARIRAGATAAELAEEMGVAESRVEPYAHPVLLERAQIAEAAKQAHPVREDGPAKLTLFEVLASAFAARGHSLADATWDATREPGDAWVVRVSWKAGLTDNEATWAYKRQMGSGSTAEARDAVAQDLTDPDFVQPRSIVSLDRRDQRVEPEEPAESEAPDVEAAPAEELEGDFLRHPDEQEQPQQRRRKAVTPHWEDVLLGVRTSQKRPRK